MWVVIKVKAIYLLEFTRSLRILHYRNISASLAHLAVPRKCYKIRVDTTSSSRPPQRDFVFTSSPSPNLRLSFYIWCLRICVANCDHAYRSMTRYKQEQERSGGKKSHVNTILPSRMRETQTFDTICESGTRFPLIFASLQKERRTYIYSSSGSG